MTGVQTCALPICFPVTIRGVSSPGGGFGNSGNVWEEYAINEPTFDEVWNPTVYDVKIDYGAAGSIELTFSSLNDVSNYLGSESFSKEEKSLLDSYQDKIYANSLLDQGGPMFAGPGGVTEDEKGSKGKSGIGINTVNDWLSTSTYVEGGAGAIQLGMVSYRQSLSIMDKIGTFGGFSRTYSV